MKYFPLFLDLEDAPVLIVGGGETALQKLRLIVKTEAVITVIAPEFHKEIQTLSQKYSRISLIARAFEMSDILDQRLVYAASDDERVDDLVRDSAREAGVLLNRVDVPQDCDFITPSIVDRDPVVVAIGTEGAAPLLAREIKAQLDTTLPKNFGALGRFAKNIRPVIFEQVPDGRQRLRLWERLMNKGGAVRRALMSGDETLAEAAFETELKMSTSIEGNGSVASAIEEGASALDDSGAEKGSVALIGAGPGDPDLLTLKALHALQGADVLVVDRLVNEKILDYARRDAKRIFVGKQAGVRSIAQEEINQILVREALSGARVVRVKGGDPNIFGRVQEELAACQMIGIDVEVVPGISAAQAASASVQLPLTFRGIHRSITWITAATKDQIVSEDLLAFMKTGRPVGVYMGLKLVHEIISALSAAGADMDQSVVVVENASLETERVFSAPLKDLDLAIQSFEINGPSILFFGLSWEEMGLMPDRRLTAYKSSNVVQLSRQVS